jgi:hypothetical protein
MSRGSSSSRRADGTSGSMSSSPSSGQSIMENGNMTEYRRYL